MKEVLTNLLDTLGLAFWVEVVTETPRCTYYFGPFFSSKTAEVAKTGYIEDLEQEGAQGITVTIKRCKPTHLTISDDLGEFHSRGSSPVFSGQL